MNIHSIINTKLQKWCTTKEVKEGRRIKLYNLALSSLLVLGGLAGCLLTLTQNAFAAETGSVIITEFMADPSLVADANGEWIEIENKSIGNINISNWDISGSTISGNIVLAPNARAVICKNININENGGVKCDAKSSFSLSQSGEVQRSIQLRDDENSVADEVLYVGSQDVTAGKSNYALGGGQLSAEQTYKYNAVDFGTPNQNNLVNNDLATINVHSTTDLNKNGKMDFNGEPGHQNTGRTIRLYNESWNAAPYGENGSNEVVTTLTNSQPRPARFRVPAGNYYICEVQKDGFSQSFVASVTSWVTWDDNGVINNSGKDDEGGICISVSNQTVGKQSTHKFGSSIDYEPALGQILLTVVTDADGDGEPDWNDSEKHQAGWQIRLYDENWNYLRTTTTNNQPYFPAWFNAAPGSYYVCEVMQSGYTQTFARAITSWVTWPAVGTQNLSGVAGEGEQCINVAVTSGSISSQLFGNAPTAAQ